MAEHHLPVNIYYEDTDFTGVVYHANYLRFFERAREHVIGQDRLVDMWENSDLIFVVYQIEVRFREPARIGDNLEVRSSATRESDYRLIFHQNLWKPGGKQPMVEAKVQLVCLKKDQLTPVPAELAAQILQYTAPT